MTSLMFHAADSLERIAIARQALSIRSLTLLERDPTECTCGTGPQAQGQLAQECATSESIRR